MGPTLDHSGLCPTYNGRLVEKDLQTQGAASCKLSPVEHHEEMCSAYPTDEGSNLVRQQKIKQDK
jgi:hypothetical protein